MPPRFNQNRLINPVSRSLAIARWRAVPEVHYHVMALYVRYAEIMELAYSITDRMKYLNVLQHFEYRLDCARDSKMGPNFFTRKVQGQP